MDYQLRAYEIWAWRFTWLYIWRDLANSSGQKSPKIICQQVLVSFQAQIFLEHESGKLTVIRFICPILNQLRSNWVGRNGTRTIGLSGPASEIVYSNSCQPAGVRKVDGIDCLWKAFSLLFIKSGKQGKGSCVRVFVLRCPKKFLVAGLALRIPAWSVFFLRPRGIFFFFFFRCVDDGVAEVLIGLINTGSVQRWNVPSKPVEMRVYFFHLAFRKFHRL